MTLFSELELELEHWRAWMCPRSFARDGFPHVRLTLDARGVARVAFGRVSFKFGCEPEEASAALTLRDHFTSTRPTRCGTRASQTACQ